RLRGRRGRAGARLIGILDMAVTLQQVDDRKIGCRLAVGYRGTLEYPPALGAWGMDTLVHQARLPHPGLADDRHHLPMADSRTLQGLAQGRHFRVPAHKAGEPPHPPPPASPAGCPSPLPARSPPSARRALSRAPVPAV